MPATTDHAHASLANAKAALIAAAKAVDPLAMIRKRPFTLVAAATGVGAVLGMNERRLMESARLTRAVASLLRIATLAVGRYMAAGASHAATETPSDPARTPAPTYGTTPI